MFTTIVIAALAGYGAYSFWDKNRFIGLCLASVSGVAAVVAFFILLFQAVALTFKLLPLIVVGVVVWLIYLGIQSRNDTGPSSASPEYTE
ncbi:hypothetical protein [Dietzia timorensis]|nr:hypothetical protein [Dietzia timorensis]